MKAIIHNYRKVTLNMGLEIEVLHRRGTFVIPVRLAQTLVENTDDAVNFILLAVFVHISFFKHLPDTLPDKYLDTHKNINNDM